MQYGYEDRLDDKYENQKFWKNNFWITVYTRKKCWRNGSFLWYLTEPSFFDESRVTSNLYDFDERLRASAFIRLNKHGGGTLVFERRKYVRT